MSERGAKLLLLSVFAARGTSFLFSKALMSGMEPMALMAVRFLLSFAVIASVFFGKLKCCSGASLRGGLLLGALYTTCLGFEMFGLRLIDTGVSALIENMAIVLVPLLLAVATHTKPKGRTLLCAVLAVAGVGCLSLVQLRVSGGALGIVLTLCAAFSYALCIIATERVSEAGADPITVGVIQLGTMGVLSLAATLLTGRFSLPCGGRQWVMLAVLVLLCSCFGFTFQPLGQKYVSAETAAVYTVINPLTASILGIIAAGEPFSPLKLLGYVLILGALLLYNRHGGAAKDLTTNKETNY